MASSQKLSDEYVITLFSEYLLLQHKSDVCKLSLNCRDHHQSIIVHFNYLCEFNSIFSELILSKPEKTLTLLTESLKKVIHTSGLSRPTSINDFHNVHIRLTALPMIPEVHTNHIPSSHDIGKFIALRAVVSRVGPIQILEGEAKYQCSDCGFTFSVYASVENQYNLKPPHLCPNRRKKCHSSVIKRILIEKFCAKNYQEIRVHEQFTSLLGVMRRSIFVCIEDDLLGTVKPGDDVVINGIVSCKWNFMREGFPCRIAIFIKANYIENLSELKSGNGQSHISNERIMEFENLCFKSSNFYHALEIRNKIIRSICPNVYGMYLIKLSLALMLVGAPDWNSAQNDDENRQLCMRIRGCPHILLIGDPGTAKSVLLRGCTSLCDRAVLTTATGTTAAGLTATAVRDASGWTLDAGALVLADGGLCAIDEFTALHGAHRTAVHEAMEQQTVSLAKAGLMARLNCRCSILAAANPPAHSKADVGKEDFGLSSPLLSRFDLIWCLVDPLNSSEWDRKISNFVLKLDHSCVLSDSILNDTIWPPDRLKEYFQWIRDRFRPQLGQGAANLLQRYYVWQRKQVSLHIGSSGRRTLRLMESLVRLTKAHARLMCRSEAIVQDAVVVIYLVDASFHSATFGGYVEPSICAKSLTPESIVSMTVPKNASADYNEIEKLVFSFLDSVGHDVVVTLPDQPSTTCDGSNGLKNDNSICAPIEPLLSSTQLVCNSNLQSNFDKVEAEEEEVISQKRICTEQSQSSLKTNPLLTRQIYTKLAKFENTSNETTCRLYETSNSKLIQLSTNEKSDVCNKATLFGFQKELTDEDFEIDL